MQLLRQTLQNSQLSGSLPADMIEELLPLFIQENAPDHHTLFREGDQGDAFYVIAKGTVSVYLNTKRENNVAMFHAGDYFGEMALFDPQQRRTATLRTLEPCSFYILHRYVFLDLLERHPKLTVNLLLETFRRLKRTNERMESMLLDARSRLKNCLAELAGELGESHHLGTRIRLRLTHQQLADMIGAVRETVSHLLLDFQDSGWLVVEKRL